MIVLGASSLAQLTAAIRHRPRGAAPAGGEELAGVGQPGRAAGRQRLVDHVRGALLTEPAQVLAVEDGVEPFNDGPVGRGGHRSPACQAEAAHIGDTAEPVKTRRRSSNPRRAQARAARAEVIAAARPLFLACGYPACTIEATGEAADVPLAAVYLHDRPETRAAAAETHLRRTSPATRRLARGVLERSELGGTCCAPPRLLTPECGNLLQITKRQRLAGQSRVAGHCALTDGLTEADALDSMARGRLSRSRSVIAFTEIEFSNGSR
ncbi:MAG: hypothetical protein JO132_08305 [Streptosporangiaceae bacterium]|nr:hypothetical protein [Streptosporangiaceae bacterium]